MTSGPDCRRLLAGALTVGLALAAALALAACGTGSAARRPGSASSAVSAVCNRIGAALSDGPDPQADPVGYAEAQIKPLAAISTSDSELRTAIKGLARAYARVFESNGTNSTAARAAATESRKVNAICPGTAS
jgi:hypothetical protein